jgi:hypothetical protein
VYALGTLGYDFGTEARRDSFTQEMARIGAGDTTVPPNPYDARQIERVSIPGRLAGRTTRLFSGQVVPVAEADDSTGDDLTSSLREFLTRVYYDLRNLGATSADRALNFAATNAFQAAHTFASAVAADLALDTIDVEKSPAA